MELTEIYRQKFEHEIISGYVYGYRWFVFAVSLKEDKYTGKFAELDIKVVDGKLPATGEILEYLNRERREFGVMPKFLWGTPFQKRVWYETRLIPYGTTITYGELARRAGNPDAARAVASALGANPIPIIVPCHRVIQSNGDLGGYTAGVEIKSALLKLEGVSL